MMDQALTTPVRRPRHYDEFTDVVRRAGGNLLPSDTDYPAALNRELRNLTLNVQGKLVRPSLTLGVATIIGQPNQCVQAYAWVCELLHVASLVLDDLPSMDNAQIRRGQPAIHVRTSEAFALFVALHAHNTAMSFIHSYAENPAVGMRFFRATCDALGSTGLIGGQYLDIELQRDGGNIGYFESFRKMRGFRSIWTMCNHFKTASLFRLSMQAAAMPLELPLEQQECLVRVGELLGFAFQLRDDVSDQAEDRTPNGVMRSLISDEQCAEQLASLREEWWTELRDTFGADGQALAELVDSIVGLDAA